LFSGIFGSSQANGSQANGNQAANRSQAANSSTANGTANGSPASGKVAGGRSASSMGTVDNKSKVASSKISVSNLSSSSVTELFDPFSFSSSSSSDLASPSTATPSFSSPSISRELNSSSGLSEYQDFEIGSAGGGIAKSSLDNVDDSDPNYKSSQSPATKSDGTKSVDRIEDEKVRQMKRAAAKEKLKDVLDKWEFKSGVAKNLRTLLSTLHNILWDGAVWKPIGLADLQDFKQIRRHYRNAVFVVHPDKVANGTPEQQVIAMRAFEAINSAFGKYKTDQPL